MNSPTKRLMGKGTGQAMEYKEDSVCNVPMAARSNIVSIAKKVEDNILHVMTALVIAPQSAMLQTPAANQPHTVLRVPNAFIIK